MALTSLLDRTPQRPGELCPDHTGADALHAERQPAAALFVAPSNFASEPMLQLPLTQVTE